MTYAMGTALSSSYTSAQQGSDAVQQGIETSISSSELGGLYRDTRTENFNKNTPFYFLEYALSALPSGSKLARIGGLGFRGFSWY